MIRLVLLILFALLVLTALGLGPGALATECRVEHDGIGAGLTWGECSDGTRWETLRSHIRGADRTEIREPPRGADRADDR